MMRDIAKAKKQNQANNNKGVVGGSAKRKNDAKTNVQVVPQKSEEKSVLSKPSNIGKSNDTSNCDYASDVFREQLSELEYSKVLGDSDLRDQNTMNFGYANHSADNIGLSYPEMVDPSVKTSIAPVANNQKLKQIIFSPLRSDYSSPPDGVGNFYRNATRDQILHQSKKINRQPYFTVCEVDSSKMRESSAGIVDGELDENFYVLTLSSKAHPIERSSSRGKLQGALNHPNLNQAAHNLNSHRPLMNQDLYYETGSAKLSNSQFQINRKIPPTSIVPKSIFSHLDGSSSRGRGISVSAVGSHHIKISDESSMAPSSNNKLQTQKGSHLKTQQDPILTSLNKRNFADSLDKHKSNEERKLDFGNSSITPGKRSTIMKTAHHASLSPNKNMSAKTFDNKQGGGVSASNNNLNLRSQPSTTSNKHNKSSDLRARLSDGKNEQSSDQKKPANVVYDEFKYFSRPFDLNDDYNKMKIEMIQLTKRPTNSQVRARAGAKETHKSAQPNSKNQIISYSPSEAFELSEKDHQIFLSLSPGQLALTDNFDQMLNEPSNQYDKQINEMKEHIMRLEKELKMSEQRSLEMLQKMSFSLNESNNAKKNTSPFLQRHANPVSQQQQEEQDSLLQSEKRAFQKSVGSKQSLPMRTPNVHEEGNIKLQNTDSHSHHGSIINLKIDRKEFVARPHSIDFSQHKSASANQYYNLKQQQEPPVDDFELAIPFINRASSQLQEIKRFNQQNEDELDRPPTEPKSDEELLATQSIPTEGVRQELMDSPSFKDKMNAAEIGSIPQPQPNCQFCECLRLLVFQAKDCIEELKAEVDTWKDACADKEAELRAIYHKLFNDKFGLDKQLAFSEDIRRINFDAERPATAVGQFLSTDGQLQSGRMKNFIVENKKRIRSRSRNNERRNHTKKSTASKSIIKKSKETLFGANDDCGDSHYMTYCDQGIQAAIEEVKQTNQNNIMRHQPERGLFNDDNDQNSQQEEMTPVRNAQFSPKKDFELETLRNQNRQLELDVEKLREQLNSTQKQCETFAQLVKKVSKQAKSRSTLNEDSEQVKLTAIKPVSIMEKVCQMKKEALQQTKIPRPLTLLKSLPNTSDDKLQLDIDSLRTQPRSAAFSKKLQNQASNLLQLDKQPVNDSQISRNAKQPLLSPNSTTGKIVKYVTEMHPHTSASLQEELANSLDNQKLTPKQQNHPKPSTSSSTILEGNQILKNMRKTNNSKMAGFDQIWKEQQEKFKVLQKQQEDYLELLRSNK